MKMRGKLLLAVLFSSYNGVYGAFNGEEVIPLCILTGGLTGLLTHQMQESTEAEDVVSMNTDPCAGNECGGQGQCVPAFCDCNAGFCGPNCERTDQETGEACPCEIPCSLCVENTCVCDCGFTFNQDLNVCVKDCPRGLGNTFTLFDGFQLNTNIAAIISTIDDSATIEELRTACNDACIQEQACRAYTINTNTLVCILLSVSKDDVGLSADAISETYERDCIGEMS